MKTRTDSNLEYRKVLFTGQRDKYTHFGGWLSPCLQVGGKRDRYVWAVICSWFSSLGTEAEPQNFKTDHSSPSSAEVKNAWRYTSTPIHLHGIVLS